MAEMLQYKCPACGGALEFNSDVQKMKCPYCETEFDVEALKSMDESLNNKKADDRTWDKTAGTEWANGEEGNMTVFVCQSCGGEIIADRDTTATSCPYCDNPVVISGRLSGTLRPDVIIPFKLDKNSAKEGLKNHLKGKRFLPKIFSSENHIDEIKGIYVPFWLFDTDADADIHYRATRTRSWSDKNYDYTETKFFSVHRAGNLAFQRIPVDGSTKMADDLMESIEPFDFSQAVNFHTAYLSGYLADKYDVNEQQSVNRADERVKASTEQAFAGTIMGYTSVIPEKTSIQYRNGKAKYALYPVWLLNTTWKDKKYTFAMNGQTGKFVGDLPVDKKKYWGTFGILSAVLSCTAYGLLVLLMNL